MLISAVNAMMFQVINLIINILSCISPCQRFLSLKMLKKYILQIYDPKHKT